MHLIYLNIKIKARVYCGYRVGVWSTQDGDVEGKTNIEKQSLWNGSV